MNHMGPQYLKIILCLLGFVSPSIQFTHYEEGTCNIIGDPDVYGTGVRISYYLSYAAALIALVTGNKKAIRDCVKGVNIVNLAMLIILIRNTTQGSFAVFEWLITFPIITLPALSIGPLFFSVDSEFSTGDNLKIGCYALTYTIVSGVQPWLFFTRTRQGSVEGCEPKAFILAYFDFYNPHFVRLTQAGATVTCILGVAYLYITVRNIYSGLVTPKKVLRQNAAKQRDVAIDTVMHENLMLGMRMDRQGAEKQMKRFKRFGRLSLASGVVFTGVTIIVCVEMILKGNNVDLSDATLGSTSQLIPFLVGLFTFVSTVYSCIDDMSDYDKLEQT